jgi:hypothetical protein
VQTSASEWLHALQINVKKRRSYDQMFGLEKLCSVFFEVSKWNGIFVCGCWHGKKLVLKQIIDIVVSKYVW